MSGHYVVQIETDPKQAGHGYLAAILTDALRAKGIEGRVRVGWTDDAMEPRP